MTSDLMKLVDRFVGMFKKRLYVKTFFCPVCHLELSCYDTDENGNMVCPLCGVLIELHETYGHSIPIVNDVEINRVQLKTRLHPLATHFPIGLFPFAFLGALVIAVASIYVKAAGINTLECGFCRHISPVVDNITWIFLFIAVASSALTFLTGYLDWKQRYGGRSYRVITLKLILSGLFLGIGIIIIILHSSVFTAGLITFGNSFEILVTVIYFVLMGTAMFILATLGHVGGYLVFGK